MASNKNKRIAAAQRYTQKGQLDKAIKEYHLVVEEDPSDVRIWLKIGDLQTKKGSILKAVQTYNKVADHYSGKGFALKAVAVYKQILNIDPTHIDAHLKLGELYETLRLAPDAIGQFQIVVGTYEREGRSRDSLGLLKKIVELAPEDVSNRIRLAEAHAAQEDTPLAVEEFTLVLDQLDQAARLDEFIQVAERLLYISADELDVVRRLSDAYLRRGDAKRALARLQVLFRADPHNVETLELLANAFQEIGQRAKAVSVFRELARIHGDQGDDAGRMNAYSRLLALAPNDPEALEATGGQPHSAEVEASMPTSVTASGTFARLGGAASSAEVELTAEQQLRLFLDDVELYLKYDLRDHAMERLQKVFELDPHNVEGLEKLKTLSLEQQKDSDAVGALLRLAEATRESDPQQAMEYLGEALQLHPNHPEATERMRALSSGMAVELASREPEPAAPAVQDDFGDLDLDGIDFDDDFAVEEAPAQSREEVGAVDFELDLGALDEPAPDDDPFGDLLSGAPAAAREPAADDDFGDLLMGEEPTPSPALTGESSEVIAPPPPPPAPAPAPAAEDDFGDLLLSVDDDPAPTPAPPEPLAADDDDDFGGLLMEVAPQRESVAPAAVIAPPPPPSAPPAVEAPDPVADEDDFGDLLLGEDDELGDDSMSLGPASQDGSIDAGDLVLDEGDEDDLRLDPDTDGTGDLLIGMEAGASDDMLIGMDEADDDLLIGGDDAGDDLVFGSVADAAPEAEDAIDESEFEDAMEATVAIDPDQLAAAAFGEVELPPPPPSPVPSAPVADEPAQAESDDDDDLDLDLDLGDFDEPEPAPAVVEGATPDASAHDADDLGFDLDLSDFGEDEPVTAEPSPAAEAAPEAADADAEDDDLDLDLGDFDAPEAAAEETPDELADAFADALAAASDAVGQTEPAAQEPAADDDGFDLDLGDFDEPAAQEPAAADDDLDLDLGDLEEPDAPEPAAADDLDLDLGDLEEPEAPEPAAADDDDLDLDLGDLEEPAADDDDLDLGDPDEPVTDAAPDPAPDDSVEDFDLDLGDFDEPAAATSDIAAASQEAAEPDVADASAELDPPDAEADAEPDAPDAEGDPLADFDPPSEPEGIADVDPFAAIDAAADDDADLGTVDADSQALDLSAFDDLEAPSTADFDALIAEAAGPADAEPDPGADTPTPDLDLDALSFGEVDAPVVSETPPPAADPLPLDLPVDAMEPEAPADLDTPADVQADDDDDGLDFDLAAFDEPAPAPTDGAESFEAEAEVASLPGVSLDFGDSDDGDDAIQEIELDDDDIIELDDDDLVLEEDDEDEALPGMAPPPPPPSFTPVPAPEPIAAAAQTDDSVVDDRTLMAPPEDLADLVLDPNEPSTMRVDLNDLPAGPPDLTSELEELDFFLLQGFADDAKEVLDDLLSRHPGHPDLVERQARLANITPDPHPEVSGTLDHLSEHEGDFGTVVGTELSELTQDDAETHFDLGVAFKEMGQHKKAIRELEIAARNADRRPEALRVIALCNLEQGNPKEAAEHLGQALTSPNLTSAARVGLHYDLATAFERLGDTPRAIAELRSILDEGATDFLDVQARLTHLGG